MFDPFTGDKVTYLAKRKWTEEQEQWLIDHKELKGKEYTRDEFLKAFPDSNFTANAISGKRTELGAWGHNKHGGRKPLPLYSECTKHGYVLIKVSATEWWPKAKWVWVATHPGEKFSVKDQFLFLDNNKSNFKPGNIRKVSHRVIGTINRNYSNEYKNLTPERLDLFITQVELKFMMLDRAEKLGLVVNYGRGGRRFRKDVTKKIRGVGDA